MKKILEALERWIVDLDATIKVGELRKELKEKEEYIAMLEAQISRDRESLIKEGEM